MTQPPLEPGQPGQQPYGQAGQPPYGQSPYGQPGQPHSEPPKRRTGLIIGLVVGGVVVIVAALLVVGLVVGGDGDSGTEAGGEVVMSGETVQGDGYSYELPEDWEDISEAVLADNPGTAIDTASAWGSSIEEARGNVIVERSSAGGVTDIEEARNQLRATLESSFDAEIADTDPRDIGDVEFLGLNLTRTNEQDVEVEQTAWISVIDDMAYVVTVSREADDEEVDDAFDAIFDSWTWE